MKGKIAEIFESVQGEGIYLGEKQLFIRFFGCNLDSCKFCDTKLDYFREYEPAELFSQLKFYHDSYHSISFTGGEPLLQKDFLKEMLTLTRNSGYKNYLETNGTLPEALDETIDYVDIVAMDIKLPSSTGLASFWDAHRKFFKIASQKEVFIKAVICQSTVEEDLVEALKLIRGVDKPTILVLQPNNYDDYEKLTQKLEKFRDMCLFKYGVPARIIPQMHKKVGLE